MNTMHRYAMFSLLAAGLAACSSTPTTPAVSPAPAAPVPSAAPAPAPRAQAPAPAQPPAASKVTTVSLPPHLDPSSSLYAQRSVFFDFDEFAIGNDQTPLIERHGRYLAGHPALAIRIEGNTDERGGTEYNLALGQKRADAVLRAMRIYGAKDAQMEAISWGESKPRAMGSGESAWAQNRRADLQYPAK